MKKILACLCFAFAATLCYAQYDLTWKINDTCAAFASGEGLRGEKEMAKVKPDKKIELIIEVKKETIDSLFAKPLEGELVNVVNEISSTDDGHAKIIIKPQGSTDIKMKVGDNTNPLAYPYQLTLKLRDGKKCKLTIGDNANLITEGGNGDNIPKPNINLLNGLEPDIPTTDFQTLQGQKENALIILDCSAIPSAESTVIRFKKEKKCKLFKRAIQKKVKHLRYGDQVGICLINFNHYRYNVILEDRQLDFAYGQGPALFEIPQDATKKDSNSVAAGSGEGSTKYAKTRLLEYAEAVKQIEEFIEYVKNNPNPNSKTLEKNKAIILENIRTSGLASGSDITLLYESLNEVDRKTYKSIYESALKFSQKRSEVRSFTYTVKANIAPIKVKSYDKLVFDLIIKDKENKNLIEKRNYEYLIIGGWQINQSFGVAGHTLFDDELNLLPTPAKDTVFATQNGIRIKVPTANGSLVDSISAIQDVVKQKIIEEQSPSKISLSATTLTHLYFRGGRWGIGPALGIGVDFYPKSNIRYLIGGSFMLMDGRFRISLDAGCVFGKESVLSANQKVGDILGPSATTPNFVDKSARSFYVGISWNIPIVPKEKQELE